MNRRCLYPIALLFFFVAWPVWAHESEPKPEQPLPLPEGLLRGTAMYLKSGELQVPDGWTWSQLPGSGEPQYMGVAAEGKFRTIVVMSSRQRVSPKRYVEEFNKSFARSLGADVLPQALYSSSDKPYPDSLRAEIKFMDQKGHLLASGLSYIGGRIGSTLAITGVGVEVPTAEVEAMLASFAPRPPSVFERLLDMTGQVGLAVCGIAISALMSGTSKPYRVVGGVLLLLCGIIVVMSWVSGGAQAAAFGVGGLVGGAVGYQLVYKLLGKGKIRASCNS